jgi:DNA-3-methyladenine glycosylase II
MSTDRRSDAPPRPRKVGPRAAARALAAKDPVIANLLDAVGLPRFPRPVDTNFAALVRSVTHQQLAGPAATAIHRRLITTLGGEATPERLIEATTEELRAAGLSGAKAASLHDLASKVLDGTVIIETRRLARLADDEIVARLSTVRGIGKWSAEIFLMFQLRRLDVWPTGDLVVRKGFGLAWSMETPTPKELQLLGEPFRPFRSVVAWYCWRAAQLFAGAKASAVTA